MMSKLDEVIYEPNICGSVIEMTKTELYHLKAMCDSSGFKVWLRIQAQMEKDLVRRGMATDMPTEVHHQCVGAYWSVLGQKEDLAPDVEKAIELISKDSENA